MPSSYTPPVNLAAPGPIGATTPAAITGTTLTATAKLVVPNGTAGAPSIIGVDTDTGIFFGDGILYLSTDAAARLTITSGSCYSVVPFFAPAGSAGSPAFGYNVDGSGMYFLSNTVILTSGATEKFRINATAAIVASGVALQLGNAATTGLTAGVLSALTNASVVIYDSAGQAYRIPCII